MCRWRWRPATSRFFQNKPPIAETFFQLLEDHNISSVITDVAGRRDVCHMRLTNEKVLIRFVGNDLEPSDYTRINDWAERLKKWFDAGLHEAYIFTHEPDKYPRARTVGLLF